MKIRRNTTLQPGTHRARLDSIQEKETTYGERLMWSWEELKTGAEIVGFTSLSPSDMANAYKWAVALNPDIANQTSWEFEDVIGRECLLRVEVVQGPMGPKNKIAEVLSMAQGDQ
jgi:hypothetical protein